MSPAGRDLLADEKEHTRRGDELARQLQALPWVKVDKPYRFDTAARSDNWPAFVATVKTGVGLGHLPTHHGDRDKELIRLVDAAPALVSSFWLLMHPDMRETPRVRAFFDYVVAELKAFRALLLRQAEAPTTGTPTTAPPATAIGADMPPNSGAESD